MNQRLHEFVFQPTSKQTKVTPRAKTPLWHRMVGILTKNWVSRWPRKRLDKIQLRLMRAHSRFTIGEWIAVQTLAVIVGLVLTLVLVVASGLSPKALVLGGALFLLSWMGPEFLLSRKITKRQATLRTQLPSTLDLLTVSVEAGLGFDQAMSKVAEEMTGPMSQETQRILHEMQLGTPRLQALKRFGHRTGVDVIELFVSAVVQADKLGLGLARVLRIQAEEVRRKQRAAAQEKATKAPVKILFPLILFVFPALFVVILGPAALHIIQMFTHMHA